MYALPCSQNTEPCLSTVRKTFKTGNRTTKRNGVVQQKEDSRASGLHSNLQYQLKKLRCAYENEARVSYRGSQSKIDNFLKPERQEAGVGS